MPIKFECACGHVIKAPGGSEGRWVRCPECRTKLAVPGGGEPEQARGAGLGGSMQEALEWQERRRTRPTDQRQFPKVEQWLMEHGLWGPLGIAIMVLFGLIGLIAYATEYTGLVPFCAFMFLIGLGSFLYGCIDLKRLAGQKDEEEEQPEEGD